MHVNIKFFDVSLFGFFIGDEKYFGDIRSVLRELNNWGKSSMRTIINTNTGVSDNGNKNIYFYDWDEDPETGDSVLVLWCEHDHKNDKIYGIDQMAKPGESVKIREKYLDQNLIHGIPTYFWIIPNVNVVAVVKNTTSGERKIDFETYLVNYMSNFSKYRVSDLCGKIIGFSENATDSIDARKLRPRVKLRYKKDLDVESEIIKNQPKIRKIVKRETFSNKFDDQRGFVEKAFSRILKNTPSFTKDVEIEHEIHYNPSVEEIYEIIQRSHEEEMCNFGFVYGKEKVMLNDFKLRRDTMLELNFVDGNIPKASDILSEILKKRDQLLDWCCIKKNDNIQEALQENSLF